MVNRIVLFSDVHGNITGLRRIFEEVEKLENVTHIIGLGDYFGWGAGGNDIVELCRSKECILIRGGHEEIYNRRSKNCIHCITRIYLISCFVF